MLKGKNQLVEHYEVSKSDIVHGWLPVGEDTVLLLYEEKNAAPRMYTSDVKIPLFQRSRFMGKRAAAISLARHMMEISHTISSGDKTCTFTAEYDFSVKDAEKFLAEIGTDVQTVQGAENSLEKSILLRNLNRSYTMLLQQHAGEDPLEVLKHEAFRRVACYCFNRAGLHVSGFYVRDFAIAGQMAMQPAPQMRPAPARPAPARPATQNSRPPIAFNPGARRAV